MLGSLKFDQKSRQVQISFIFFLQNHHETLNISFLYNFNFIKCLELNIFLIKTDSKVERRSKPFKVSPLPSHVSLVHLAIRRWTW
jgi:hypothetical protein